MAEPKKKKIVVKLGHGRSHGRSAGTLTLNADERLSEVLGLAAALRNEHNGKMGTSTVDNAVDAVERMKREGKSSIYDDLASKERQAQMLKRKQDADKKKAKK
jgi:hypothetical protein